jgi:hypothetical protein
MSFIKATLIFLRRWYYEVFNYPSEEYLESAKNV